MTHTELLRLEKIVRGKSSLVTKTNNEEALGRALVDLSRGIDFRYSRPIPDFPCSIRMFSSEIQLQEMIFMGRVTGSRLALELMRLTNGEARYEENPGPNTEKGWEIRRAMVYDCTVVLAIAAWV